MKIIGKMQKIKLTLQSFHKNNIQSKCRGIALTHFTSYEMLGRGAAHILGVYGPLRPIHTNPTG